MDHLYLAYSKKVITWIPFILSTHVYTRCTFGIMVGTLNVSFCLQLWLSYPTQRWPESDPKITTENLMDILSVAH